MKPRPINISVTSPIGFAIERVKLILFKPFDLGKWFAIGFCAWLARLGEHGMRGNYSFNPGSHDGGRHIHIQQDFEHARSYVMENLAWLLPIVITVAAVVIVIGIVFLWLNSRGKFMFLHGVALNRAEITEPWNRYSRQGNSLFLFRLVMSLIGAVLTLPLLIFAAIPVFKMIVQEQWDPMGIAKAVGVVLVVLLLGIFLGIVRKLTVDFVVPIMFLQNKGCLEAWREFWGLLSGWFGEFLLYLLFQIVMGIVIGALVVAVVLITCCVAGCLLALPYLGTVLFLPVLVFKRAYSLYFLAQFGSDYDAFSAGPQTPEPPTISGLSA